MYAIIPASFPVQTLVALRLFRLRAAHTHARAHARKRIKTVDTNMEGGRRDSRGKEQMRLGKENSTEDFGKDWRTGASC